MAGDWIKLHRSIIESGVWADDWLLKLWIWCLLRANYADRKWKNTIIKRGQFVTGRFAGAEELGVHPSKWYRGMAALVSMGNITTCPNNQNTIVTVVNYDTYQDTTNDTRTTDEQPLNNQRTTDEQPANTREEGKKLINTGTGPKPSRVNASEHSKAAIANRDDLAAVEVSPLSPLGVTNGQAIKAIDTIDDWSRLLEWWRRHLGTEKPLTGPTVLDLLHVLCCATECRRSRAENKVGLFGKRLASGKWVEATTGIADCYKWIAEQINTGRLAVAKAVQV